ncbi:hypothetical protein [Actinomadura gamaensis]|uniref:Uncharacterized protein n=1 Tax=Actinomadura gamaensis TaxID=1763541 RepID=A0ABV9TR90_9ACTN
MRRPLSAATATLGLAAGFLLPSASAHAASRPDDGVRRLVVYQMDDEGNTISESLIAAQGGRACVPIPIDERTVREFFDNDSGASIEIYTNGTCAAHPIVRAPWGSTSSMMLGMRPSEMGVIFRI